MFVEQIEEHTTHGGVVLQQTPFDQDVMTIRVAWCLMGSGLGIQPQNFCPRLKPQCQPSQRVHASHQRSPITSSISYTARAMNKHSNCVASSLNHGFHVPEDISSLQSHFGVTVTSMHGRRCFRILPTHPLIIPVLCSLILCNYPSASHSRKETVGFGHFTMLYSWSCKMVRALVSPFPPQLLTGDCISPHSFDGVFISTTPTLLPHLLATPSRGPAHQGLWVGKSRWW